MRIALLIFFRLLKRIVIYLLCNKTLQTQCFKTKKNNNKYLSSQFVGQETGCCLIQCRWLMVFLEELQSSCQMGCSQLKVQQGKVLLTSSFSGCRQASKHPLPTELTRAVPQVCLIICQLTSPKPSNPKEHEHAKTVREPQHRSHCLFITQCHSAQLKLKGKRLHKYRASLGNYYILSNFYSLETL